MNSKIFNKKTFIKGIGYLVLYFVLPSLISIPFNFLKKDIPSTNFTYNLDFILKYSIITIIFIIISRKNLKKDIKEFNVNTFKKAFKYWLIGATIMIISSTIISLFKIPLPINENLNRLNFTYYPITQIFSSVFFAPIIEEIIFRLNFKELSTNKHIYALSTGILFAIIHLPDAFTTPIMLIHLIPYASVGIAFGYSYFKTKNIMSTITTHSLHNLITIIQLFIIGG